MKISYFKLLLPIAILIISCKDNQNKKEFEKLEIWEIIKIAAKEKQIDYLLEISKDTLDCTECIEGKVRITKEEFFNNYLEKMEVSDTKEYRVSSIVYEEDKRFTKKYYVFYSYGGIGPGNGSVIYSILVGEKTIQFQGIFTVP